MPLLIGALVEGEGELASGGVGDDRLGAAILQPSSQRRAVISLVAKQLPGCSGATDKTLGRRAIMRLAAGQEDGKRPLASAIAWIFVLRPPRERPTACFCSPLFWHPMPNGEL